MKLELTSEHTLLEALRLLIPDSPNRTLRQLLRHGRVHVNGEICRIGSRRLVPSDLVEITRQSASRRTVSGLRIVFEDSDLLLVEKPAGLLTVSTSHEKDRTAFAYLREYLKEHGPRQKLFIVHRLDKLASGVLVFAKSESVQARLRNLFSRHDIQRKYYAVVEGSVEKSSGTIRSSLAENRAQRMHSVAGGIAGKPAVTHFRVLRRFPQLTLLEVTLETGRKNQIRVHMSDIGHPIVGDRAYGSATNPLGRLGLHAFFLGFMHPVLGKRIEHTTPIPAEFARYFPK